MDRLTSIVVGVDFSPFSGAAIAQASRLARANAASLRVMHVVEEPAALITAGSHSGGGGASSFADLMADEARARLEGLVAQSSAAEADVSIGVRCGTAYLELLREARDVKADLIVLGASGMSSDPTTVGANAVRCVRKASAKVLLVRGEAVGPFRRVAACLDFSPHTPGIVDQAVRIARADSAELWLVHAHTPPWMYVHYRAPTAAATPVEMQAYRQTVEANLRDALEPVADQVAALNVRFESIERVNPKHGVIEALSVNGADLAVIGSRGRTSFGAMLLGSMAEHIFHRAPCSVLIVKPAGFHYAID